MRRLGSYRGSPRPRPHGRGGNGVPLLQRWPAARTLLASACMSHASCRCIHPGMYETSVTRPDLFRDYFTEQIGLLMQNHGVPVEIGESDEPIPITFLSTRH